MLEERNLGHARTTTVFDPAFFQRAPHEERQNLIRDGDNVLGPKEIEELARSFGIKK
jgi:hypothetical protein